VEAGDLGSAGGRASVPAARPRAQGGGPNRDRMAVARPTGAWLIFC